MVIAPPSAESRTRGIGSGAQAAGCPDDPLVNSAISHRSQHWAGRNPGKAEYFKVEEFQLHRFQLRIVREEKSFSQPPPAGKRGEIQIFSDKSRARLRHKAKDADPALISQFTATYADGGPKDGRAAKAHLDAFLKRIRRKFPRFGYLWVLEFQGAGNDYAPHFHVFLTIPYSLETARFLGQSWHEVAGDGNPKHLAVAMHPRSFITWDMGTGNYVCKYLEKMRQKEVPDGYLNVGRFWGASGGLVPSPSVIKAREMAEALIDVAPRAVKQATRWVAKWHEKYTKGRSRARRTGNSYTIPTGAPIMRQILQYFMRLHEVANESPF